EPADPLFAVTAQPGVVPARVELSSHDGLVTFPALVTARPLDYGDTRVWIVGGVLLSQARADALAHLTGARVELVSDGKVLLAAGDAAPPVLRRTLASLGDAQVQLSFSQADLVA